MHQEIVKIQKHYRINEAAGLLGLSRSTIYLYIQEGRLKAVKYGKRALGIPADSLREFMQGGGQKSKGWD